MCPSITENKTWTSHYCSYCCHSPCAASQINPTCSTTALIFLPEKSNIPWICEGWYWYQSIERFLIFLGFLSNKASLPFHSLKRMFYRGVRDEVKNNMQQRVNFTSQLMESQLVLIHMLTLCQIIMSVYVWMCTYTSSEFWWVYLYGNHKGMLRLGRNESMFMNHWSVSVQTQNFLSLVCPGGLFLLQGSDAEKKNGAEPDKGNRSSSHLGNSGVHPIKTSHFLLNAFFFIIS